MCVDESTQIALLFGLSSPKCGDDSVLYFIAGEQESVELWKEKTSLIFGHYGGFLLWSYLFFYFAKYARIIECRTGFSCPGAGFSYFASVQ